MLPGDPSRFSNFRSPVTVMLPHLIMITHQVLTLFLHERKPSVDPYSGLLQVRPAASSFPIMVTQQVMTRFLRCNFQAALACIRTELGEFTCQLQQGQWLTELEPGRGDPDTDEFDPSF